MRSSEVFTVVVEAPKIFAERLLLEDDGSGEGKEGIYAVRSS